ncbi:MAG: CoA transferase [Chloroflexi bacterium]|nr:CoA transferase [Chloroflexota bacterium]
METRELREAEDTAERPQALAGVKVVVIGGVATAPTMARYFALHGATVVRVDSHVHLDTIRWQRPFFPHLVGNPDGGVWYATLNSSALGIAVDWTKPMGLHIMRRLVRWADVVIENFLPGALAKRGLDYSTIARGCPEVIYLSSCLMGQDGPWAGMVGYGQQATAIAGVHELCGFPDDAPTPIETMYTDFVSPRFGVTAILAALEHRRRTGRGQYLDQSQVESGIHFIAPLVMDWTSNGRVATRTGSRNPAAAPHGVYRCAGDDRWLAIGVFTDEQWRRLCRVEGIPEALKGERFGTLLGRKRHEDELDALLGGWTRQRTAEQVEAWLQAQGVPAAIVADSRDTRRDPQLNARGFFRRFNHKVIGEHTYRGPAFRLSRTPDRQFAGPALGEHSVAVCKMIGMSEEEIAGALSEGALATGPSDQQARQVIT